MPPTHSAPKAAPKIATSLARVLLGPAPLFAVCLASCTLAWAGSDEGPVDEGPAQARDLLQRMNQALADVPFEGTIVYAHDDDLSALRIAHRVQQGAAQESLLSLTGPVRAMSRHWKGVTCMLPDAAPLNVRRPSRLGTPLTAAADFEQIERHYDLRHRGGFRIAGRDTDVIVLLPRDDFRYGRRFFVDRVSGLPLKSDLLDADGRPVQQVMFTDIDIGTEPTEQAVDNPHGHGTGVSSPGAEAAATDHNGALGGQPEAQPAIQWRPRELPPGFSVVSRSTLEASSPEGGAATDEPARQLLVSDGVASFSIYIEPPLDGALQGESRLGAVSAAGGRVGGHQVTVVGEVPPKTVRSVLSRGLRPADSSASR